MRALLLAAGRATRLGDLSVRIPKCLHLLGSEVLFDRLVRQLSEVGVREFLVNTHHLAPLIREHIRARPDRHRFTIVYEQELLGTLGTLRANANFFGSDGGWVLHADNFIEGHLSGLREGFDKRPSFCLGAMLTYITDEPSSCGVVEVDGKGVATSFFEKVSDPPNNNASAASFLFDGRVMVDLAHLPAQATDISRDLLPRLMGRIVAVPHSGEVIDIGTLEGLERARSLARKLEGTR